MNRSRIGRVQWFLRFSILEHFRVNVANGNMRDNRGEIQYQVYFWQKVKCRVRWPDSIGPIHFSAISFPGLEAPFVFSFLPAVKVYSLNLIAFSGTLFFPQFLPFYGAIVLPGLRLLRFSISCDLSSLSPGSFQPEKRIYSLHKPRPRCICVAQLGSVRWTIISLFHTSYTNFMGAIHTHHQHVMENLIAGRIPWDKNHMWILFDKFVIPAGCRGNL